MKVTIASGAIALLMLSPRVAECQPRPLVDHHQHFFGPSVTALSRGVQPITGAELIVLLNSAGIQRAVVLSVAYQFGNPNRPPLENEYELVKAENDWTSQQVGRYSRRLRGFCSVNPLRPYALEEIARCGQDPQLHYGLKLHFGNSDVNLHDKEHIEQLRRVFAAANRLRMAIIVHMRASVTRNRPHGADEARIFVNDLLPAAPDVPVQIAHLAGAGGYDDPGTDEALAVFVEAVEKSDPKMANVYFDVSGVAGLGQWITKMDVIAARIRALGVGRILYGSDGAGAGNLTPREAWAAFRRLPLTRAEVLTIANNIAPYLQ